MFQTITSCRADASVSRRVWHGQFCLLRVLHFLDWLLDIKSDYIIKLPKTKEDIAHVEELFLV
jgi:hypothetical protein